MKQNNSRMWTEMKKHAYVLLLFILMTLQGFMIVNGPTVTQVQSQESNVTVETKPIKSASDADIGPLKANLNDNPSFEEYNTRGVPSDYSSYGTAYEYGNSTYSLCLS